MAKAKDNVQTIGEIAKSLLFDRCECCGYGLKCPGKKWCQRCIDVYTRKQQISRKQAEAIITNIVGLRYHIARLANLDVEVKTKLDALEYGQDLFIFGEVGTGKTYTMAALIRRYVYQGYECERINFDSFCVKVRSTFSPAAKTTAWAITEKLKSVDKLFIDDLGLRSTPESQFAYDTFYDLLNKRQEKMLPTHISSNKTIEQLGQTFDQRIASRLRMAMAIEMKGADRRLVGGERK